jgi:hypothetical protein
MWDMVCTKWDMACGARLRPARAARAVSRFVRFGGSLGSRKWDTVRTKWDIVCAERDAPARAGEKAHARGGERMPSGRR